MRGREGGVMENKVTEMIIRAGQGRNKGIKIFKKVMSQDMPGGWDQSSLTDASSKGNMSYNGQEP